VEDLGAVPMLALLARNPRLDPTAIEEVFYGCANQAGEDDSNVARMSLLLAGLPYTVPGVTLNRLCASGLEAVGAKASAIPAAKSISRSRAGLRA
jgi:3-oxoadipyl-CoA thiolase